MILSGARWKFLSRLHANFGAANGAAVASIFRAGLGYFTHRIMTLGSVTTAHRTPAYRIVRSASSPTGLAFAIDEQRGVGGGNLVVASLLQHVRKSPLHLPEKQTAQHKHRHRICRHDRYVTETRPSVR